MRHHGTGTHDVIADDGEVDHAAGIDDRRLRIGEDSEVGGFEHEEALDPFAIEAGEVRSERRLERDDADGRGHASKAS